MNESQAPIDELSTLADFVRWGTSRFEAAGLVYGHGTDNAADEALYIVQAALNLAPGFPEYFFNCQLTRDEKQGLAVLFERRITERKPAAYLTGRAWFMGLSFHVDERVLIPRSPFAELLAQHCQPWVDPRRVRRVLDLCTGSGCIAIAAARVFPEAQVAASDLSSAALEVAAENIQAHDLGSRVSLFESDCFDNLPRHRYQLIISNPPYVDYSDMQKLAAEFRHEPSLGLAAGKDGLDVVRRILAGAPEYLEQDGVLMVEVGNSAQALISEFPGVPFTWIDFEHGGDGVFVLTAEQLADCRAAFEKAS